MPGFSAAFSGEFAGPHLPLAWVLVQLPQAKICTLLAQLALIRGEGVEYHDDGRLTIGDRDLIGPAGKVYRFVSPEGAAMWSGIALERGRREIELARGMDRARRVVWLARKRATLADFAAQRARHAAQDVPGEIRDALIADASFALVKWGHYA